MIRLEQKAEILSGYLGEWLVALCAQSRYVPRLLQSDRIRDFPEAEGFYGRVRSQAVVRRLRPRVTRAISVELVDMRVNTCYWDRNGRSNATGFIAFIQVSFASDCSEQANHLHRQAWRPRACEVLRACGSIRRMGG